MPLSTSFTWYPSQGEGPGGGSNDGGGGSDGSGGETKVSGGPSKSESSSSGGDKAPDPVASKDSAPKDDNSSGNSGDAAKVAEKPKDTPSDTGATAEAKGTKPTTPEATATAGTPPSANDPGATATADGVSGITRPEIPSGPDPTSGVQPGQNLSPVVSRADPLASGPRSIDPRQPFFDKYRDPNATPILDPVTAPPGGAPGRPIKSLFDPERYVPNAEDTAFGALGVGAGWGQGAYSTDVSEMLQKVADGTATGREKVGARVLGAPKAGIEGAVNTPQRIGNGISGVGGDITATGQGVNRLGTRIGNVADGVLGIGDGMVARGEGLGQAGQGLRGLGDRLRLFPGGGALGGALSSTGDKMDAIGGALGRPLVAGGERLNALGQRIGGISDGVLDRGAQVTAMGTQVTDAGGKVSGLTPILAQKAAKLGDFLARDVTQFKPIGDGLKAITNVAPLDGKLLSGMAKGTPVLGAGITAAQVGYDVVTGMPVDRALKNGAGSLIGGAIGSAIGTFIPIPVVGTVAMGALGGYLGGKIGDWISDMDGDEPDPRNTGN